MTSDRMMQALGRIERAISRLEAAVDKNRTDAVRVDGDSVRLKAALIAAEQRNIELADEIERQREAAPTYPEQQDAHAMNPFSHDKALAALRSLDSLIDDLQRARTDG